MDGVVDKMCIVLVCSLYVAEIPLWISLWIIFEVSSRCDNNNIIILNLKFNVLQLRRKEVSQNLL